MIRYVMYVDDGGVIRIVKAAKGINPPEGMDEDTGFRVVYYTAGISDINEFIRTQYWTANGFQTYPPRPNDYAEWDGTAWTFEFSDVLAEIRLGRDWALGQSDYTQLPDSPYTDAQRTAWATYRQQLRDFPGTVPNTVTSIGNADWPTPPQ